MVGLGTGDGNQVALHNPTEHNLRGRLLIFRGQRLQERMPDDVDVALSEGALGLDLYTQRVVVSDVLFLGHQRMHLYLVDGGQYLRV